MSAVPPFPTRPDQMPDATLDELVDAYGDHLGALLIRRVAPDATDKQLAGHGLAALAVGTAALVSLTSERWRIAHDCLAYGASLEQVGAAVGGFDRDEVARYVAGWALGRRDEGLMSTDEYRGVLDLLDERTREAGR